MTTRTKRLPPIGARIVKSALGSAICILIYALRCLTPLGGGTPFYSCLAVLWCIQPYNDSTILMAKQRSFGTLLGAAYGLVFLLVLDSFDQVRQVPAYLAACAMLVIVLYTTVLLNKRNSSYFSCVVFLAVAITHSFDENPYLFVFNRVCDTEIGIVVALILNIAHRPRQAREDVLYVTGIDEVLLSSRETMLPYTRVELNRLITLGAHITLSTVRTPAAVLELMGGIQLKMPIIAMNGAVLYDPKENRYLEVCALDSGTAAQAEAIAREEGAHIFVNAICDETLHIYYGDMRNDAERSLFEKYRRSPYRNYTREAYRLPRELERVIYLMALLRDDHAQRLADRVNRELAGRARAETAHSLEHPGYTYVKIFAPEADKAHMLQRLAQRLGTKKIVTVGSIPDQYDIYVHDDGGPAAVKAIEHHFLGKPDHHFGRSGEKK